jgi:uncharacterized peroxidase-related enzyme
MIDPGRDSLPRDGLPCPDIFNLEWKRMSWLRNPDESSSIAAVQAAPSTTPWSRMSTLWRALRLDTGALDALLAHGTSLVATPSTLSAAQIRMIALVVSATNGCGYAVAHLGPWLAQAIGEPLAKAVARDYRDANLAARDRVLLDYAVALTCEPSERKREDVERVREYGFEDGAILRATHVAAWFGLLDRLASGLGIELEPDVEAWEFGSQR